MKQILILLAVATSLLSCTGNGNSGSSNNAMDSVAAEKATKDSMVEKNKATALASVTALFNGKIDEGFKDCSADYVDYGDGSGAPVKGADSSKAGFKMFITAFPDMKGENLLAIGDGNHVAVFGDWSGTFKGEFMGMKPTGKSFKVKDVDLFTFNDAGKITEHRSVQSAQTYISQVEEKMKKK
jgi:predicted ester cyclase